MFTKSIKTLTALIISLFALSSLASAQYGLPDFTDIDIDALLDKVDQQKTAAVNAIIGGIIEDTWRDSQVSFSYQQFVERSKCTSRQQFPICTVRRLASPLQVSSFSNTIYSIPTGPSGGGKWIGSL